MVEKGYVSKSQNIADKLNLDKAKFTFEQVNTKRDVLVKYTKEKTIKELRADVEKARADELTRKATSTSSGPSWRRSSARSGDRDLRADRRGRLLCQAVAADRAGGDDL